MNTGFNVINLPGFDVRLEEHSSEPVRWWPYLYEVLLCQWVVLLKNQQRMIEKEIIEDKSIHAACIIGKGGENGRGLMRQAHYRAANPFSTCFACRHSHREHGTGDV